MAHLPTNQQHDFCRDLRTAQEVATAGIVPSRSAASTQHWNRWSEFCHALHVDPYLTDIQDPIALLQVYGQRYRTGVLAPHGRPVRSRTVEDSWRAIGQTLAMLGSPDPRQNQHGDIDFRLQRQLRGYARTDAPPNRVKPVPIEVIRHLLAVAFQQHDPPAQAIADMICLAYFFLLRPGEYTGNPSNTTPFTLADVQCYIGQQRLTAPMLTIQHLSRLTFVTLTFTSQKNGVRGEVIGLGRSGDPILCPVMALSRRLQHLLEHQAPPTTPLATYYTPAATPVTPTMITTALRTSTTALGPTLGFLPSDISARSLRAAGAMALLCAQVDTDVIRLLGRWRSDEMLRYLHVQAEPVMRNFARFMLHGGSYQLHPNQHVPLTHT